MGDASARRVKIDPMFPGEGIDFGVLLQILRRDILNIMIDGEDRLRWIRDLRRADLPKLWNNRAGVIMRHHMTRPNRHEFACVADFARRKSIGLYRRNLIN